ncbi:DUF1993 family protein [Maricaulis sp.]|uniref:DUF1993 domain-containing protein n=1 Tax=Maricaulis sp. TaxID=1486257 RepID=UPI0026034102|nr:DUF1993 domain-containing protein [Maricaulis sp.]
MSITLSSLAKTQLDQTYRALGIILSKGEAHASECGVEESVYLNWRLAADMYPLTRQIQLVSDFSYRGLARLAGVEPMSMSDDEATFEALRARIDKAREAVWALDPAAMDADPQGSITFPAGPGRELTTPRQTYVQNYVLANTMFHAATAYDILRNIGVPLGKADMMGMPAR